MVAIRYGVGALLLCIAPFFFIGGPDWVSPPLYRALWGAGHMLFFALFALWLHSYWSLHRPSRWLWLTLGVVGLSLFIEITQSFIGRDGNWRDGLSNLAGTWFALFWLQPAGRRVWLLRLAATALLLWHLQSVGQAALNLMHRMQHFPVLSDFEHRRDLNQWRGDIERVREPVVQGDYSLAVQLGTEPFSGVGLDLLLGDWRHYQILRFSLYNPDDDELPMTLRINDQQHDRHDNRYVNRFNHRLLVQPGWNHFRIDLDDVRLAPEDRDMDMARVQRLGIFATNLPESRTVYLDAMYLE